MKPLFNRSKKPLSVAVTAALSMTLTQHVAFAQDADDEVVLTEEIVVTGSRIAKQDFVSNSPVSTVDREQFVLTNTINTESLLNSLPQTVPGFDRTSNNPGNGTATVDLRGLGANRTLVLMNGKRVTPTSSSGVVDINSIPASLIKNVEVLTGGASAVYGSDAVAGVVNFILRDDFEGVELNMSTEQTEKGDAGLSTIDLTIGGNFGGGRGNAVMNLQWTDREDLFQGDRGFSTFAQFDDVDASGNPILIDGGSSGVPGTSIFAGSLGAYSPDSFGVTFDPNGAIRPFRTSGDNDFYNYAPVNYIQLPQERYQATALASFEMTDHIELYSQTLFTSSSVPQQLAPTPIFQVSEFTIDGNPFLTGDSQQVLSDAFGGGVDANGNGIADTGTAFLRRRLEEVGPRVADSKFTSFQFQVGAKGSITDSWNYDAYYQFGQVDTIETQLGNVNRDRFSQALMLDTSDPTGSTCADSSANGSTTGCAPINIWGQGNISEEGAAFLRTAVSSSSLYEQQVMGISISGDLFELPAGTVGVAAGVERIDNDFRFRPSQDLAAGTIAGFNGSPAVSGAYDESSFFAEAYIPILRDAPLAALLDLGVSGRWSDFSTVGSVENYKIDASWAPIMSVRFRGSFSTATRAPNIGELFSPQGEGFPGSTDPCAAEGNPTPDVAAICAATGVPAADVGNPGLNLPAGQVRQLSGGNPDLDAEEADTWTAGIVYNADAIDLSVSLDYFDIEIEGYISSFGGGANNVLNTCYDATNPLGGIGSPFCDAIKRRADGTIEYVSVTSQNVASNTLKGFDLQAQYRFDGLGGQWGINYVATFTEEADFTPFEGADVIECAGKYGNDCGEPLPDYTHRATLSYARDSWMAQAVWRYVGESEDDDDDTVYFADELDAESYVDVSASYGFSNGMTVMAGIDNLMDTDPPIMGDNAEQANTYPATYDVFGRSYFVRFTWSL